MAQKYTKLYYAAFDIPLHQDSFVPSELSGARAVDIHHICTREHRIENLMALTRQEHMDVGEVKRVTWKLLRTHRSFLIDKGVPFDDAWFQEKLNEYNPFAKQNEI